MHDRTIVLLADLGEFPQAQFYAEAFSILFIDIGEFLRRGELNPPRYDYSKVYIAVKDKDKYSALLSNYTNKFDCEYYDDIPEYKGLTTRDVAIKLLQRSYVNPFDDLIAERHRAKEANKLRAFVASEESKGRFVDPNPKVELDKSIRLMRKKARKDLNAQYCCDGR